MRPQTLSREKQNGRSNIFLPATKVCHPSCSMSKPLWLPSSFPNLPLGLTPPSPPAPKYSPEPTGAAAVWEEIQLSAVHTREPLAENIHLPPTRLPHAVRSSLRYPYSPYRWRWWICRTDPCLEPIQSPTEKRGAKVSTKCYSGLEDSASAQPGGWKEPVTSKEGQQEDRRGTKGALMEFNNSPADRLELDLWK